jgi:hypothetical protein
MQHSFDVYEHDPRSVKKLRIEKEAFERGVQWANNRSIKMGKFKDLDSANSRICGTFAKQL